MVSHCEACGCELTAAEIREWEDCEAEAMVLPGVRFCDPCCTVKVDEEEER